MTATTPIRGGLLGRWVAVGLLSAGMLKFFPSPFVWLGLFWAGALFWLFSCLVVSWARVVTFNLAALLAIAAGCEAYLSTRLSQPPEYSEDYFVDDDVLGTVPAKQIRARSTRYQHGKLTYDVTYTIDANGHHVTPPTKADEVAGTVIFLGCSFTFGEGVQDNQTLPFQLGVQSAGRYQTYNFGFHGYGPHQMLAAIESGRVKQIVPKPMGPLYAIYQALPDHVARVAGKVSYHRHAPRYRLDGAGMLRRDGHFDDGQAPPSWLSLKMQGQLRKSASYLTYQNLRPAITDRDIELMVGVVARSRDLLLEQYPGIEFRVVLWRNFASEAELHRKLTEGFQRMHISVIPVGELLPGYDSNPEQYWLNNEDRHPNARAHSLLAEALLSRMIHFGSPQENK